MDDMKKNKCPNVIALSNTFYRFFNVISNLPVNAIFPF